MTYKEFIDDIIAERGYQGIDQTQPFEKHHIIPRCMGGSDDEDNIIFLYLREHYIAHKLLALENPHNGRLLKAWNMMSRIDGKEITEEEYVYLKTLFREDMSKNNPNKDGHVSRGKKMSQETKDKISLKKRGVKRTTPIWNKGKKLTEEHKKHCSESLSGLKRKPHSDESKQRISESLKGRAPWNKGKKLNKETGVYE